MIQLSVITLTGSFNNVKTDSDMGISFFFLMLKLTSYYKILLKTPLF